MNTRRIVFTFAGLLLAMAVLSGLRHTRNTSSPAITEIRSETNHPFDQKTIAIEQNSQELSKIGITPGMTKKQREEKIREWYIDEASKTVPQQQIFRFYGKVVDEKMRGVAEAGIHFVLSTTSSASGVSERDTISLDDGSFSLTDVTGSSVSVYPFKTGYYVAKSLNRIDFDPSGSGSTVENPVLFHLVKKGAGSKLITSKYGVYPYFDFTSPRDGSIQWIDLLNRKTGPNGQIKISQIKPPYENWKSASFWKYQLSIPDGGFVETNEEFPFEAPETGYQPMINFNFQKGSSNWTDQIDKTYYVAFGSPRLYGRVRIKTSISSGTSFDYAVNPSGSRNLEPQ